MRRLVFVLIWGLLLVSMAAPAAAGETVFDERGRVERQTDDDGRSVAFFYDDRGRLIRAEYDDGKVIVFLYDASGHPIRSEVVSE